MTTKSLVVSGEASETDSDDEDRIPKPSPNRIVTSIQGAAIVGEDSESDNEKNGSVSSATSAMAPVTLPNQSPKSNQYNSLLHTKLRESNREIRRDLETYIHSTISDNADKIDHVEQNLLKSQLTLQAALTSLRCLNSNSSSIKNKLKDVLSAKFINSVSTE